MCLSFLIYEMGAKEVTMRNKWVNMYLQCSEQGTAHAKEYVSVV